MLNNLFAANDKLSLKAFAEAIEVSYQPMLKQAKKPIAGVAYDPEAINYEALTAYIEKKLDRKIEDIIEAIDWKSVIAAKASNRASDLIKSASDINVGDKVYLRLDKTTPFEVIYKTATHVVIMKENTEEPISWSWTTFFFKGPKSEPRSENEEA